MRVTVLEDRLYAMHSLLGSLIAHLDDGGLIDRQVLENDTMLMLSVDDTANKAIDDMRTIFRNADSLKGIWERARSGNEG